MGVRNTEDLKWLACRGQLSPCLTKMELPVVAGKEFGVKITQQMLTSTLPETGLHCHICRRMYVK